MGAAGASRPGSAVLRGAAFLLLWVVLAGTSAPGLVLGVLAAGFATWASLALLPPVAMRPRGTALAGFVLRFPTQAVAAGLHVALLALDPRRRPAPAHVAWQPRLPPGPARDAFLAYTSLLPGTLPAGEAPDGAVVIHALTGADHAAAAMAEEEARFARAFGFDG